MIDEGTTPPVGRSIAEQLREIDSAKPDKWTMAWIKSQFAEILKAYRGLCHFVNLVVATSRDHETRMNAIEQRLAAAETENQLIQARMGEIQAENVLTVKRVDDMAAWAKTKGKKE